LTQLGLRHVDPYVLQYTIDPKTGRFTVVRKFVLDAHANGVLIQHLTRDAQLTKDGKPVDSKKFKGMGGYEAWEVRNGVVGLTITDAMGRERFEPYTDTFSQKGYTDENSIGYLSITGELYFVEGATTQGLGFVRGAGRSSGTGDLPFRKDMPKEIDGVKPILVQRYGVRRESVDSKWRMYK
jgi:hypothetical protein